MKKIHKLGDGFSGRPEAQLPLEKQKEIIKKLEAEKKLKGK